MNFPGGLTTEQASNWAFDFDCKYGLAWKSIVDKIGEDQARCLYKIAFMSASMWSAERLMAAISTAKTPSHILSMIIDERLGTKPIE